MVDQNNHLEIIKKSFNSKQLVLAGPGTGKTFSIIERIKYLINNESLLPTEILILSFSVAAIKEILKRIDVEIEKNSYPINACFITIRTFDSFASHLLLRINPEVSLSDTYDERIHAACITINENKDCQEYLRRYRHIIIDEVQDLVGNRANLAISLLSQTDSGFTILGDPAQAIYEYLGRGNKQISSDEFMRWLKSSFPDLIIQEQLKYNFRVGNNKHLLILAEKGRDLIFNYQPGDSFRELMNFYNELPEAGSINEPLITPDLTSSATVILCRNNGQVLLLGRKLSAQGKRFRIIRRKEDYSIPVWLGRLLSGYENSQIKREIFEEKVKIFYHVSAGQTEDLWNKLKDNISGGRGPFLEIRKLREMLYDKRYPVEDLDNSPDKDIISLSSIHRAKGREFENVIVIVDNEGRLLSDEEKAEESRILYVGITRAKNKLLRMRNQGFSRYQLSDSGRRWIRLSSKRFLTEIEVGLEGDFDIQSPVSLELFEHDHQYISENVNFIGKDVKPGDEVRLVLYKKSSIPVYRIEINNGGDYITTGLTSLEFGRSMTEIFNEINGRISKYPDKVQKLWVKDVVTELGNTGDENVPKKYRNTGLWPGLRVEGIGECIYS